MIDLITSIVNKDYVKADSILSETVELIMAKKLHEAKKKTAAKMCENGLDKSAAELTRRDVVEEEELEEQEVASGKMNSMSYNKSQTTYINDVIKGKPVQSKIGSTISNDDKTPAERARANDTQRINTALKTPAPRAGGYTDARTNKPYVPPTAKKLPLRGPTTQGSSQSNIASKSDRVMPSSPVSVNNRQNTTVANKVNEEELDEARVKIVKARIRGGKIQRRKKVSNVPGMTMRGGKLKRMTPAERRHRKMGQRRGKLKRKAKMNRAIMKRQRSLRKRKALGL